MEDFPAVPAALALDISTRRLRQGAIAIIKNGDKINIDIPRRKLELLIPARELQRRLREFKPPKPKVAGGYLARYAKLVSFADKAAILNC